MIISLYNNVSIMWEAKLLVNDHLSDGVENKWETNWTNSLIFDILNDYPTSKWLDLDLNVSFDDCKIWSNLIKIENSENEEHPNHMLSKTPETLYNWAKESWVVVLRKDWKPVWFIGLMKLDLHWITLFERGSLILEKEYRNKKLWKLLIDSILRMYPNLPIYSITTEKPVMLVNTEFWLTKYLKNDLPSSVLAVIEWIEPLLEDDVIFWNKKFDELVLNEKNND